MGTVAVLRTLSFAHAALMSGADVAGGSLSLCEQTVAFDDGHSVRFCAVRGRFVRELASRSGGFELRLDYF
jgi:hypothetical protein